MKHHDHRNTTEPDLPLLAPAWIHSQFYLGVIKGEVRKIPLVVLDLFDETGQTALRDAALKTLQDDLRRSQIFDVLTEPSKLDIAYSLKDEPGPDFIKRAGTFGITGVVWARLSMQGKDLVLTGRLFDAATGSRLFGKEYFGNAEAVHRMMHSFADDIVTRFTGEKGIARTRIAFVSDKTGKKELSVMDYDGRNIQKLTADRSICTSPAWSPDGQTLAYVSYRDRNPDLYGLDLSTGRRWKISGSEGLNISPAWSPNGKRIAAALSRDGSAEIYTMSRTGTDLERLTYGVYDNVSPSWSPNGREIVFNSGRAGTPQLYIMGADGTDVRRITFEGNYNASPQWSPRADRIVFVTQVGGFFKIATISPDGSNFALLTQGRWSDENPPGHPAAARSSSALTAKGNTTFIS
jgi:TolB protein